MRNKLNLIISSAFSLVLSCCILFSGIFSVDVNAAGTTKYGRTYYPKRADFSCYYIDSETLEPHDYNHNYFSWVHQNDDQSLTLLYQKPGCRTGIYWTFPVYFDEVFNAGHDYKVTIAFHTEDSQLKRSDFNVLAPECTGSTLDPWVGQYYAYLLKHMVDFENMRDDPWSDTDLGVLATYHITNLSVNSDYTCTFNLSIPSDYLYDYFEFLFFWVRTGNINVTVKYVTIDPYPDQIRELEDSQALSGILGSDEEGSESGIKGIFKHIKELPGKFSQFFTSLGDRISGFFNSLAERIANIMNTLKDNLINGIKSLFVPSDGFFDEFKANFDELLSDHLGVIYQAGGIIQDIFSQLKQTGETVSSFNSPGDYYIKWPAFRFYVNDQSDTGDIISTIDNGGQSFGIFEDSGDGYFYYHFDFLDGSPYSMLYSVFRGFMTVVLITGFVYFAKSKFDQFASN